MKEEVLAERFSYDEFRRDVLSFIDQAVLHTLLSRSVSDKRSVEVDGRYRQESQFWTVRHPPRVRPSRKQIRHLRMNLRWKPKQISHPS